MAKYEYSKLKQEVKTFFNHIERNFGDEILSNNGIITTKELKGYCDLIQEMSVMIDDPMIAELYNSYGYDDVINRFNLRNNILNATFNGNGNRGEYYFPFKTESELSYDNSDYSENVESDSKSDEEILLDQMKRFNALSTLTHGILNGVENGLFCYGAGGLGKSIRSAIM